MYIETTFIMLLLLSSLILLSHNLLDPRHLHDQYQPVLSSSLGLRLLLHHPLPLLQHLLASLVPSFRCLGFLFWLAFI